MARCINCREKKQKVKLSNLPIKARQQPTQDGLSNIVRQGKQLIQNLYEKNLTIKV